MTTIDQYRFWNGRIVTAAYLTRENLDIAREYFGKFGWVITPFDPCWEDLWKRRSRQEIELRERLIEFKKKTDDKVTTARRKGEYIYYIMSVGTYVWFPWGEQHSSLIVRYPKKDFERAFRVKRKEQAVMS